MQIVRSFVLGIFSTLKNLKKEYLFVAHYMFCSNIYIYICHKCVKDVKSSNTEITGANLIFTIKELISLDSIIWVGWLRTCLEDVMFLPSPASFYTTVCGRGYSVRSATCVKTG